MQPALIPAWIALHFTSRIVRKQFVWILDFTSRLVQKQLAYMLGRQQVYLELNEDMDEFDELTEIMSNAHLNNNFLALAREVGVQNGKALHQWLKVSNRRAIGSSAFYFTCMIALSCMTGLSGVRSDPRREHSDTSDSCLDLAIMS